MRFFLEQKNHIPYPFADKKEYALQESSVPSVAASKNYSLLFWDKDYAVISGTILRLLQFFAGSQSKYVPEYNSRIAADDGLFGWHPP